MLSDTQALQRAIVAIPITSPEYPDAWRKLSDAPQTLYALGDSSLLKKRRLTVVGSRRTPPNAMKLGGEICAELSKKFVLATGTADGGDTAAIEGALQGSGEVICLLAGGFSALPQAQLATLTKVLKRGLILSPHPFEMPVRSFSYEYRNKLLALLGEGTFVLGAGEKSGALITARYAALAKLPIFAFPYPPNSSSGAGCNRLIKQGGRLVEGTADILQAFGMDAVLQKEEVSLSADEGKVYEVLQELGEGHATELAARTGIPVFKLRAVLSALEVKGKAVSLGGNRYASA